MAVSRPEATDLERRVLAHERILQTLIAYMSRTEPRFVDHLRDRFVEPMNMARHEHDYRDSDDYAEEFMRAVMLLGDAPASEPAEPEMAGETSPSTRARRRPEIPSERPRPGDRVQVRERNGIWEVKVDGAFRGDYHQKEHALATAALLKLSLR